MGVFLNREYSDDEEEDLEEDEPLHLTNPPHIEGDPDSTFYALVHFFDAASRSGMPPSRPREGCFPHEIYALIIDNIVDRQTREACMEVSRTFRDYCLEKVMLTTDMAILPSESCKDCEDAWAMPTWFTRKTISSGAETKITLKQRSWLGSWGEKGVMQVFVGDQQNRKSLLPSEFIWGDV